LVKPCAQKSRAIPVKKQLGLAAANISKKLLLALPNLIVALADYQLAENN
jgi:hypothetical protein